MIVLSLDTTARAGSAALVRAGRVIADRSGDPALTHGQRLPGELMRLVAEAGITLDAVDLFAVAAGPGSFTGLRVGIAAIQGLAMATGKPIVPVSTLEALATAGSAAGDHLLVPWVDAQRGEVFAAVYAGDGRHAMADATALPPEATLALVDAIAAGRDLRFIGDGAVRYADVISTSAGAKAVIDRVVPHLAPWIGLIAAAAPERAVAPHAVAPIYIRRPDAELARDRRAQEA